MTIGGLIQNPLTYLLMKRGPWLSIYVGLGLSVFCILLGFCLPESLKTGPEAGDMSDEDGSGDREHHGLLQQALTQAKAGTGKFLTFLRLLISEERQVGLLLLSLLFTTFGRDSALMLIQYIHVRFKWEWSEASYCYTNRLSIASRSFTG